MCPKNCTWQTFYVNKIWGFQSFMWKNNKKAQLVTSLSYDKTDVSIYVFIYLYIVPFVFLKMTNDFFMFWIFLLKCNKLLNHYIQVTQNVSHIIGLYLLIEIFIIQFLLIIEWINLILVLLNFHNRTNIVEKSQWFMLRATKSNISV